ncbi:MAG: helicase [Caldilineaceae bacterium]
MPDGHQSRAHRWSDQGELRAQRQRNAILLNEAAEQLFASHHFTTAETPHACTTIELTVRDLGFPHGAITATIDTKAAALGHCLCPLQLGPLFRLHYLDQPEGYWGQPVRQYQAPRGLITIASAPLTPDDDFPKGFYVRRIQGELWLRGYRAGPDHVWAADDHLLFCQA